MVLEQLQNCNYECPNSWLVIFFCFFFVRGVSRISDKLWGKAVTVTSAGQNFVEALPLPLGISNWAVSSHP